MTREIYIRDESDPYYEKGIIDYNNEIESVVSQIRMILGTKKGQVFGEYNFGIDLEYLVFNTKRSADAIMDELNDLISEYVYHSDKTSVNCTISFGNSGEGYDYAVIDIYINGSKTIGILVDEQN